MQVEEFKNQYLCEPSPPSDGVMDLARTMLRYYATTEHMNNRAALSEQRKLSEYIKANNFSTDEKRQAKSIAIQMHRDQDYSLLRTSRDN